MRLLQWKIDATQDSIRKITTYLKRMKSTLKFYKEQLAFEETQQKFMEELS